MTCSCNQGERGGRGGRGGGEGKIFSFTGDSFSEGLRKQLDRVASPKSVCVLWNTEGWI